MQKFIWIAVSFVLLLSLAACSKEAAKEEPKPDATPQGSVSSEPEPQGDNTEYQTYQIQPFGIEFDCPDDFAGEAETHVLSEYQVLLEVNGAGDVYMSFDCSRIESMKEWAELADALGQDSTALYEAFQSLDVDTAIVDWKKASDFELFELLDQFSAPTSYGFYYMGKVSSWEEDEYPTQICFNYKNYGDFVDDGGIINVSLLINAPESMDREEFTALCEAVTGSLRMPGGTAPAPGDGAQETQGTQAAAMKPLTGGTYDQQCREIVELFFDYASPVRYGGSTADLMQLLGGNQDLFGALEQPGEVLCGSYRFTSELAFQDCGQDGGGYYINVMETRDHEEEGMGTVEYAHTFSITINSPTDYCITWVDSVYQDNSDQDVSTPSTPANGEDPDPNSTPNLTQERFGIYDPEAQRDYGSNAQISEGVYYGAISCIMNGDYLMASFQQTNVPPYAAVSSYQDALDRLGDWGYSNTPLYSVALYRWSAAQQRVEECERKLYGR